jgi:GNAT superfamily N-acetyltransferase
VLTVRRASPADTAALRAVAIAAYEHYTPRIGRPPAPMMADYAAAVHDNETWVAAEGAVILAFIVLIPRADHLLLDNLAVLPSAQGRGIGSRLLELAEDQARSRGLGEVRLYTNEVMTENLTYYSSRGYTETHRGEQDGYRRVFFRKPVAR